MWTSLIASFLILLTNSHIMVRDANFFSFSFFFFLSLMILTVVNTNNCTRLSKGRSWEKWSLSQRRIMLYNREEKHDCRERIYTYIISRIILPFFFFLRGKYSDGIWTPTNPLWVNIALFWMRSLMHTASSGKTVYASMCHLGLCVSVLVCVCVCTYRLRMYLCAPAHTDTHTGVW